MPDPVECFRAVIPEMLKAFSGTFANTGAIQGPEYGASVIRGSDSHGTTQPDPVYRCAHML